MTTQTYAQRTDPAPCLSPMDARKADMIGYIRRKYSVPDYRDIVIKQGYITKDILPDPGPAKSWYEDYDNQLIIKRKLSGAAASAVEKMKKLIDHTNEEIRALLEAREADAEMQALGNDWLRDQIIQMTDGMFVKLSDAIKALARESYEKAYARTNSELGGIQVNEPPSSAIFDKEQFKLIFAALEKAKARMTDRIEEAFNAPTDEPEDVQKIGPVTIILGALALLLLAAVLTGCEATKKKAEQLAGDAEHLAKIEAEIAAFLANGVEKYEIVTEPGCCDVCADMTDQFFDVADYSPGVNAPPFHPNCRCEVRVYEAEEKEPEFETINDWLNLFDNPTITDDGRVIEVPEGKGRSWYAFEGQSKINYYVKLELEAQGLTPEIIIGENGEMVNEEGRYWIAVGPRVLNPDFRDDQKPNADKFNWNVKIDVVVMDSEGNLYYIPCVPGDVKAHTYPNGIFQTGSAFPNGTDNHPQNADGSAVEFMGAVLPAGLRDYELVRIIVYDA